MAQDSTPQQLETDGPGVVRMGLGSRKLTNETTISLFCLFQILTGCSIFFACLRISVVWTVIATLVVTPAIIRTGLASQICLDNRLAFGWHFRIGYFLKSVFVVLAACVISAIAFSITSLMIGLFCGLVILVSGPTDMFRDAVLLGIFGGMFWGIPAALIAIGYCAKHWKPRLKNFASPTSQPFFR